VGVADAIRRAVAGRGMKRLCLWRSLPPEGAQALALGPNGTQRFAPMTFTLAWMTITFASRDDMSVSAQRWWHAMLPMTTIDIQIRGGI
jgi:hypothetical protein